MQNGGIDVVARKFGAHLVDDLLPKRIADAFVQRAVAEHGVTTGSRRNEDQCGIAMFGAVKARRLELFLGARIRIHVVLGDDTHRDVPRRSRLRFANGARNAPALQTIH